MEITVRREAEIPPLPPLPGAPEHGEPARTA
jgi:hypothetical protein